MSLKADISNPPPLSRGQKAAMTRRRNQVAQMVAEIVAEKPQGPRVAKTAALKNAIWKNAQNPSRKRATPPNSPQKAVRTKKTKSNRPPPRFQLQARTYRPPAVNVDSDEEGTRIPGTLVPAGGDDPFIADAPRERRQGKGKAKQKTASNNPRPRATEASASAAERFVDDAGDNADLHEHDDDPFVDNAVMHEDRGGKCKAKPLTDNGDGGGYEPDYEESEIEDDACNLEDEGDGEDDDEYQGDDDDDDDEEQIESDGSISNKLPKVAVKMLTDESFGYHDCPSKRPKWAEKTKEVAKNCATVIVRNRVVPVLVDEGLLATDPASLQATDATSSKPKRLPSKFQKVPQHYEDDNPEPSRRQNEVHQSQAQEMVPRSNENVIAEPSRRQSKSRQQQVPEQDASVPQSTAIDDDTVPISKVKPRPLSKIKAQQCSENGAGGSSGRQNVSRRQQAQEQEVPVWNTDTESLVPSTDTAVESSAPLPAASSTDTSWPACAILRLNSIGDVNLRDQSPELRVVIQTAIHKIISWIIFQDAFPSLVTRATWNRDALLQASADFMNASQEPLKERYRMIRQRVALDLNFVKNIGRLPDARISIYRGGFKSACVQIVQKFYNLKDGCAANVMDLVNENKYIFHVTTRNQVLGHKPYEHPAIAEVIKQRLFDDPRHPITEEFPEFFSDGEKLTQSIVAFAATAIRAAIQEWSTGKRIPQEFTANAFTDIYLGHMLLLNLIKKHKPRAHAHLLTQLFRNVSCNRLNKPSGTAYLDLQNMQTAEV
ncbi:hypothetical protein M378DRAFT_10430 [Amanita muscaria Koide BX008]|uniref:DUF6532 domain-containing protein n=1 Tax=Amanita muscaria (strain Koide BX008) TaxID=946122 RepID=A0A0C2X935_AMAMK|nr:hypothetical protein M378DRAFT_10430 [Amanita muscaria Koide BX008]